MSLSIMLISNVLSLVMTSLTDVYRFEWCIQEFIQLCCLVIFSVLATTTFHFISSKAAETEKVVLSYKLPVTIQGHSL